MLQASMPKRSRRYGVGKEIGGAVYVHREYESILGNTVSAARERIPEIFNYTIVKLNLRSGMVTFVCSPDFDTANEPVAGAYWIVPTSGSPRFHAQAADPFIYHHKWLMVRDDYLGFDVEASKERSRSWLSLDGIDKTRIGLRSYWMSEVEPRLETQASPKPLQSNVPGEP